MSDVPDPSETGARRRRRHLADGQWAPGAAADHRTSEAPSRPPEAVPWYLRVLRSPRSGRPDDRLRRRAR